MSDIVSFIENLSTKYNDNLVMRLIVSFVPHFGTPIEMGLAHLAQKTSEKRLSEFLDYLVEEIKKIDSKLIEGKYFKSEAFQDLTIAALSAASRNRFAEKSRLFAKILRGAYETEDESDEPEEFIRIIENLTIREMQVLKGLAEVKNEKKIKKSELRLEPDVDLLCKNLQQYQDTEIDALLARLEAKGLVKEHRGIKSKIINTPDTFEFTPIFDRLQKLLAERS